MNLTPQASDAADETGDFPPVSNRPPRVSVEVGAHTHRGMVRENNEDNYLVAKLAKSMRICRTSLSEDWSTRFSDEEGYLLVVADGMGGMAGGEKASQLAVETIEGFVLNVVKWFLHFNDDQASLIGELKHAFQRADSNVMERARQDPRLWGMGTTLTMAYSVGSDLFVVHAGDTRAYLLHSGELRQLTNDHTLVNLLVQGGTITAEAARTHSRRNVVTNVIGGPSEGVHTEIHKVDVADGDVLLLCSDGLTEPVRDDQIAQVLKDHIDPDAASRKLIDLALQGGAPDNVTAVVARYSVRD